MTDLENGAGRTEIPAQTGARPSGGGHRITQVERWPCGCAVGVTPHGVGWKDCIFTREQRAKMEADVAAFDEEFVPTCDTEGS